MTKWCSYDAEGDAGEKGLLGVSIVSDKVSIYCENWEDARKILSEHAKDGYTFVSHNAQYDIPVVFWQNKEDVRLIYYNQKFNHGVWLYDKESKPANIWDSLGLSGNIALADLGRSIGLPKYDTPQRLLGKDVSRYAWKCDRHDAWECEECYAIRDAEIVYNYMASYESFLAEYGVRPKRTIGSAAVALWKSLGQKEPIQINDDKCLKKQKYLMPDEKKSCTCLYCLSEDMGRKAYYGGRVECFKLGEFNNVHYADVTSMYPFVMANRPMPNPKTMEFVAGPDTSLDYLQYEGVSEVNVYHPQVYIPCLPFRKDAKLQFPCGVFRGHWTHCEIRNLLRIGGKVLHIHRQMFSRESVYPFSTYVGTLMQLREQYKKDGDSRQQTVKILLNSLYGRIGIRIDQEEETMFPLPRGMSQADFPGMEMLISDVGSFIVAPKMHSRTNPYSNVLWAANITGYARLHLYHYLMLQGSDIIYCDTDSILSLSAIHGLGSGLGALDKAEFFDTAFVSAPKVYSLHSSDGAADYRAKGVPRQFAQEYIEWGKTSFNAPYKPREAARRGKTAGEWHTVPRSKQIEVDKRDILDPLALANKIGWTDTKPHTVYDDNPDLSDG